MMAVWRLGPDRAAEWRAIRLEALAAAPDAFDSRHADWCDRPLADFAARLAACRSFAAGPAPGTPLAVAAWERDMDPRAPMRGWVLSVYARPSGRGTGTSDAVLAAVADDARAQGMTSLGLHVGADNLPAQRLYARAGFAPSPRPAFRNANGVAEIEMLRTL